MKPPAVALFLAVLFRCTTAEAVTVPVIEQGIYRPAPPFVDLKQSIYVRERERPVLGMVTDASTSIVRYLLEVFASTLHAGAPMPHVLPEARAAMRLPPLVSTGGPGRYVAMTLYCWTSDPDTRLSFLIEWADITTNARYTDSYVFERRGGTWFFAGHGNIRPWHWTQTERYFQRACPVEASNPHAGVP
ncbi:hypothetical protein [Massilia sp. TN1-12]|uniref:hypothetical protein n=1 Tax=Massilia paldalensis TaxID=3377675 RepID=UPI0038512116